MDKLEEMVNELLTKVERLNGSREEFKGICDGWMRHAFESGMVTNPRGYADWNFRKYYEHWKENDKNATN